MSKAEKFEEALFDLIDDGLSQALAAVTGAFVSLTLGSLQAAGHTPSGDVVITGGAHDITIHQGKKSDPFQTRVQPWLVECFGEMVAGDAQERSHRFLEEALELVQACECTAGEAHELVDYVFGRPVGEAKQEVGGVMLTLAALCLARKLNMDQAAETELARVWSKVDAIRAKQAAKPKFSPLPGHAANQAQQSDSLVRFCPGCGSVGDVPGKYENCCPDGGHARVIPESLARRCHDLFQSALDSAASAESVKPTMAGLAASVGHLSQLVDEQLVLLSEVERVCGVDEWGEKVHEGESRLMDRIRAHLLAHPAPQPVTTSDNSYDGDRP